jgi:hypothetical protein
VQYIMSGSATTEINVLLSIYVHFGHLDHFYLVCDRGDRNAPQR